VSRAQFSIKGSDEIVELRTASSMVAGGGSVNVELKGRKHVVQLRCVAPAEGSLHIDGRIVRFYAAHRAHQVEVWLGGRRYIFEKVRAGANRSSAGLAPAAQVSAPMPGTVLRILVEPGEKVQRDQPLIVMESMKMEMTLSASAEGSIAEVACSEGQMVQMGAVLVRFEDRAGS